MGSAMQSVVINYLKNRSVSVYFDFIPEFQIMLHVRAVHEHSTELRIPSQVEHVLRRDQAVAKTLLLWKSLLREMLSHHVLQMTVQCVHLLSTGGMHCCGRACAGADPQAT